MRVRVKIQFNRSTLSERLREIGDRSHVETQENSYNPDNRLRQTSGIKKTRRRKGVAAYPLVLGLRRTEKKVKGTEGCASPTDWDILTASVSHPRLTPVS